MSHLLLIIPIYSYPFPKMFTMNYWKNVNCRSPLGSNMYTYLKFGLPRVFPPNGGGPRGPRDGSSGYDSSDDGGTSPRHDKRGQAYYLRTRSDPDFRNTPYSGVSI